VATQNKFGQPKTVLHVVVYKFKDATSENDRQKALDGIKDLARKNPRRKKHLAENQPQIRSATSAASTPSSSPTRKPPPTTRKAPRHEAWAKQWEALREKQPVVPNHQPLKIQGLTKQQSSY